MRGYGDRCLFYTTTEASELDSFGTNDLLIFDESDQIIQETPLIFEGIAKRTPVISLSATAGNLSAFEREILSKLEF